MDALELTQVDIFAYSIGVMTAQWTVLKRPERVRRFILVGCGPGGIPEEDVHWPRTFPPQETFTPLIEAQTDDECREALATMFFRHDEQGVAANKAYFERLRHSEFNPDSRKRRIPKVGSLGQTPETDNSIAALVGASQGKHLVSTIRIQDAHAGYQRRPRYLGAAGPELGAAGWPAPCPANHSITSWPWVVIAITNNGCRLRKYVP